MKAPTLPPASGTIFEVARTMQQRLYDWVKSTIKIKPRYSNWGSTIGHPCVRQNWYWRTQDQLARAHGPDRELLFKDGHVHEAATIQVMRDAGFDIIEQQRPFKWPHYQITGHIDGKIVYSKDRVIPFEVKGYGFQANSLRSVDDFLASPRYWARMAPAQLSIYMAMDKKLEGLWVIKHKLTSELRFIGYELRREIVEEALAKAVIINEAVAAYAQMTKLDPTQAATTGPERIPYDKGICGDCSFCLVCLEDVEIPPAIFASSELEAKVNEWASTAEFAERHEALDVEIKAYAKTAFAQGQASEIVTTTHRITGAQDKNGSWRVKIRSLLEADDE